MRRRGPRVVLWGGRAGDYYVGSHADRARQHRLGPHGELTRVVLDFRDRATAALVEMQRNLAEMERRGR